MAEMDRQELLLLGKIDGKLDGISAQMSAHDQRLIGIEKRLRVVEQKAAVTGAISGGAISVGLALIIEGAKQWMSRGSGH